MPEPTPKDPTYDREAIDANPAWKLAFYLSELDNDNAPIGWGKYIRLATVLTSHATVTPRHQAPPEPAPPPPRNDRRREETGRDPGRLPVVQVR